jgi:hypothetical protein
VVSTTSFLLDHFYYGHQLQGGKPGDDLRQLGASAGVKPEQIAECIQLAIVPPFRGAPEGTWALVRGKFTPYILVQSQMGQAGQFVTHFILMPAESVRAYSGNLKALAKLLHKDAPVFERPLDKLMPIPLDPPQAPDATQQTHALLALMSATHDRIQTIETMLAAVISGATLIVQGAPPELEKRAAFIEGLQALLPPPARSGVTFSTHATPQRRPDAIVTFYTDDPAPPGTLAYHWGAAEKPTGIDVSDDYARFITSQLRLDTALVLEQTAALTPVAAWRIKRGDGLGESLRYAAQRLKVDHAVRNNLPVELDDAARVLAEDPTLSDALRLEYASHLLKLSLPLGKTEYLPQVAEVAQRSSDIEMALLRQMTGTLATGSNSEAVYDALVNWIGRPDGVTGLFWIELAQRAALEHADALVRARDAAGMGAFIQRAASAPPAAQINVVMHQILERALPMALQAPALARIVFAQAARAFSGERFYRLCTEVDFLRQLPAPIMRLQPHLLDTAKGGAPGLLTQAAGECGPDAQDLLTLRFSEIAVQNGNLALVDASALTWLAHAAQQPWAQQYDQTFRFIVRNLSSDVQIARLGEPGARSLAQVLLARRAYPEFAALLTSAGKALYEAGDQIEFADFMRLLFLETPLTPAEIQASLKALAGAAVKPLPLMMAHYGALEQHVWSAAMGQVAGDLNTLALANPRTVEQAPIGLLLALIKYHTDHGDRATAMRVTELIPDIAVREGEGGVGHMLRLCYLVRDDTEMRSHVIELLRRYVRHLPESDDRKAADRLSARLGGKVKDTLEATLLLKRLFDGVSVPEYAGFLHVAADFLHETGLAYVERERAPGLKILLSDLDSLNGGFSNDDRKALVREMILLGKTIAMLAQRQKALRQRETEAQVDMLLDGSLDASGPLDLFRILGGYFARGTRVSYKIEQTLNPHPFGARSAPDLLHHAQVTNIVLRACLRPFPVDSKRTYSASAIRSEIESLWDDIPLHDRRRLVRDLAVDFQRVPSLVLFIAVHGSPRVLNEDDGQGKRLDTGQRRPESTFELYRFVSGYFRKRVR